LKVETTTIANMIKGTTNSEIQRKITPYAYLI
jgi:hypothetical protein